MSSPRSVTEIEFPVEAQLHPSPRDWRDQFIYFLLVDRFDDNDPAIPAYTGSEAQRGREFELRNRFQGGNLKGVLRRLDYIQQLGCTAIWLSPILKNRRDQDGSYHGYGIQDFLEVDPRFGTFDDLRALTRAAHQRGMYVVMDVVINHSGDVWAYPDDHPYYYFQGRQFPFGHWRELDSSPGLGRDDAVWPVELQSPEAFKRRGQIRNWYDEAEARNGDFLSLKELDVTRPDVLDALIKAYKYWIAAADIDGFRIDTVKHLEDSATAIFCNAIREYARRVGKDNFFIFGEIVADDATIERYLGRNSRIEGTNERFPSLDAALDFPLYFSLEDVIKGFADPGVLRARYDRLQAQYADRGAAGRYFVTFVDNHDQMARPYRRFMHGNPFPAQAALAIAYLLTTQGVPCIYYGTEQAFDGGGDDDAFVRECMFGGTWGAFDSHGAHFFNPDHAVYRAIRAVADVRARIPALRCGRQYFREVSTNGVDFFHPGTGGGVLAYSRILDTDEVVVVLNLGASANARLVTVDRHLAPPGTVLRDLLDSDQGSTVIDVNGRCALPVELEPHSVALYRRR
jgi:glycosidase